MAIGETYGRPLVVRLGHPGCQIFPGLVAVPVSVDDEISRHKDSSFRMTS